MQWRVISFIFLGAVVALGSASDAILKPLLAEEGATISQAKKSQQNVGRVQGIIEKTVESYRAISKRVEGLEAHNKRLVKQIEIQVLEIRDIDNEIKNVAVIRRQITPLMEKMTNALETSISLDLPFHEKEREDRIQFVRDALADPKISPSEKLRQVFSAYAVEGEYGRKLDSYRQKIMMPDGIEREVDILRMGRLSLMYITTDEKESGYYNRATDKWEALPSSMRNNVRKGLRIAKKQAAVDLMLIPVDVANDAK